MAGFEPAISCSRNTRNTRLSYILPASPKQIVLPVNILRRSPTNRRARDSEERPAGVEPALPPWQGDRLPLHHGRVVVCRIVKDPRAPGETRTLVAALRVRYPRRRPSLRDGARTSAITSVGPEGLEPSPGGLRIRYAAANTLIPYFVSSPVGAEGIEPSTRSL